MQPPEEAPERLRVVVSIGETMDILEQRRFGTRFFYHSRVFIE
jgi:hypothetical protein